MTRSAGEADLDLCTQPELTVTPRRAGLVRDQDNIVEVLVRVQAPDAPAVEMLDRPPQAIALVIDRSASMAGAPLAEAKRCAERVVSRMKPDDVVSLVAFDWRASVLWPATEVGDGRGLLDAIATIAPVKTSGMTNLLGGWRAGLRALDRRKEINFRRVFLMSDGFVNRGVTDAAQIAEECARGAGIGVGTSTYRIGPGPGNGLMTSMARAGRGRGYDQDRDEDRLAPFEQELALLENLALLDPILQISATEEGCTLELVNDLTRLDRNFFLPPVAWGGEAWVALRVHVPKSCVSGYASEIDLLRVRGEALAVDDSLVWLGGSGLPLPLLSIEEWDALEEDELVSRRFAEAQAR